MNGYLSGMQQWRGRVVTAGGGGCSGDGESSHSAVLRSYLQAYAPDDSMQSSDHSSSGWWTQSNSGSNSGHGHSHDHSHSHSHSHSHNQSQSQSQNQNQLQQLHHAPQRIQTSDGRGGGGENERGESTTAQQQQQQQHSTSTPHSPNESEKDQGRTPNPPTPGNTNTNSNHSGHLVATSPQYVTITVDGDTVTGESVGENAAYVTYVEGSSADQTTLYAAAGAPAAAASNGHTLSYPVYTVGETASAMYSPGGSTTQYYTATPNTPTYAQESGVTYLLPSASAQSAASNSISLEATDSQHITHATRISPATKRNTDRDPNSSSDLYAKMKSHQNHHRASATPSQRHLSSKYSVNSNSISQAAPTSSKVRMEITNRDRVRCAKPIQIQHINYPPAKIRRIDSLPAVSAKPESSRSLQVNSNSTASASSTRSRSSNKFLQFQKQSQNEIQINIQKPNQTFNAMKDQNESEFSDTENEDFDPLAIRPPVVVTLEEEFSSESPSCDGQSLPASENGMDHAKETEPDVVEIGSEEEDEDEERGLSSMEIKLPFMEQFSGVASGVKSFGSHIRRNKSSGDGLKKKFLNSGFGSGSGSGSMAMAVAMAARQNQSQDKSTSNRFSSDSEMFQFSSNAYGGSSQSSSNANANLFQSFFDLTGSSNSPAGPSSSFSANKFCPVTVQWLLENYETAEGVSLPRSTLYYHYLRHCNDHKLDPVNAASFGKLIRSVFLGLRTRRLGTRGNSKYHYYGIRLKPNSPLVHVIEDSGDSTHVHQNHSQNPHQNQPNAGHNQQLSHSSMIGSPCSQHENNNSNSPSHDSQAHGHGQGQGHGPLSHMDTPASRTNTYLGSINNNNNNNNINLGVKRLKTSKGFGSEHSEFGGGAVIGDSMVIQQFLGDSSRALDNLPELDLKIDLSQEGGLLTTDDVLIFRTLYREHCESLLDTLASFQLSQVESYWRNFWRSGNSQTAHCDHVEQEYEKMLPKAKLQLLCTLSQVQDFIRETDYQFYQNIVGILVPDVLRPIPSSMTQAIRNFAKTLENWLSCAMADYPSAIVAIKLSGVNALAQTLRRYTSLNHLAQAARAVLQNETQIAQMLSDLNRVDFHNVEEQASWVCGCDGDMVPSLEQDFKATLARQQTLEDWATWLEGVVDRVLRPHLNSPRFVQSARHFLLKWSFYSSLVIRDLTLRSAASFGSFHLLRLLYDEYMFYLVEHRVAQVTGIVPIAVIGKKSLTVHPSIFSENHDLSDPSTPTTVISVQDQSQGQGHLQRPNQSQNQSQSQSQSQVVDHHQHHHHSHHQVQMHLHHDTSLDSEEDQMDDGDHVHIPSNSVTVAVVNVKQEYDMETVRENDCDPTDTGAGVGVGVIRNPRRVSSISSPISGIPSTSLSSSSRSSVSVPSPPSASASASASADANDPNSFNATVLTTNTNTNTSASSNSNNPSHSGSQGKKPELKRVKNFLTV